MRAKRVEVLSPPFDQRFRFLHRVEDFPRKQLVSELGVEALAIAVLPGRARFDVERPDAEPRQPFPQRRLDKFRAVIRPNVIRRAVREEEVGQHFENNAGVEPSLDPDRQAFPCELINDAQHAERFPVMGSVHHKVVTPYMVLVLRPEPHAGAVIEP